MTKLVVFGALKILCENPWAKVGMSTKTYYLRNPQPWVIDPGRASPAQKAVWEAFTAAAQASIRDFPADGSFRTLINRVKSIGSKLRGKTYTTPEMIRKRLPKSAIETHPLKRKLAEMGAA